MTLAPGTTIGGYRVLDVLGVGGTAVVYRAEQLSLGREGKTVAARDQPNVAAIRDLGEESGRALASGGAECRGDG